jgi:hypothetical protein
MFIPLSNPDMLTTSTMTCKFAAFSYLRAVICGTLRKGRQRR